MEDALPIHEELVTQAPKAPTPWLNYGHALKIVGRLKEAVAAYRKSLELDPANGFAWIGLANLRKVRLDDHDITQLNRALQGATDDLQRVQLHFALGKALGDCGRYEHSFRHYQSAHEIRHRLVPYDAAVVDTLVRKTEALFTAEFLAERSSPASGDTDAIFIVGMPRSGSTLLEQILASHPMVEGLGELFDLQNIVAQVMHKNRTGASWLEVVENLSADECHALGESYIASVRQHRKTERPFFIDKMPSNWRYIGLIRLILPKARIIDIRRHPIPCCFSNFTTYFNAQTVAPNSLDDLSRDYLNYVRMVSHFEAVMPGTVHRIYLERLIGDFESEVRQLLEYLNLPFDQACLSFHENSRPVYTPSAEQVRRPINGEGLYWWRNYEAWLSPLQDKLGSTWESYPECLG